MYKNATKCNETIGKWCKNKHGASKIIDTFETYQQPHHKLGAKYLVVLCAGLTLSLAKQSLDEALYKLSGAITKLAGITFLSLAFSWI
jgi:hypothetical protein